MWRYVTENAIFTKKQEQEETKMKKNVLKYINKWNDIQLNIDIPQSAWFCTAISVITYQIDKSSYIPLIFAVMGIVFIGLVYYMNKMEEKYQKYEDQSISQIKEISDKIEIVKK